MAMDIFTQDHVRSLGPEQLLDSLDNCTCVAWDELAGGRRDTPASQNKALVRAELERRLKRHAHVEATLAEWLPRVKEAKEQYEATMKELGYRD